MSLHQGKKLNNMENSGDSAKLQAAKTVVQSLYKDLDKATEPRFLEEALKRHVDMVSYHWRGMHPFYEIDSIEEVAKR